MNAEGNMRKTLICVIIEYAIAVLLAVFIVFYINSFYICELNIAAYSNNNLLGYYDNVTTVSNAEFILESNIASALGVNYEYEGTLTYKIVNTSDTKLSTLDDCCTLLNLLSENGFVYAYTLHIDGQCYGSSTDKSVLDDVVKNIEAKYASESFSCDNSVVGVKLLNDVCIESKWVNKKELTEKSCGDSYADNDIEYGVSRNTQMQQTSVLSLKYEAPASSNFKYEIIKRESYLEVNKCVIQYNDSENYYAGYEFQTELGSDGVNELIYDVGYIDGEVVSRSLVKTNTVIAMIPTQMVRGIKPTPPREPTGNFIWPLGGDCLVTSLFGVNRNEFDGDTYHFGIDIVGDEGDDIYASDGGVVIHSDTTPSYGMLVQIDHGGKFITYYAHMSKAYVEVGDKVYQGQRIGLIGMTGVTTAPHLHFEVRGKYGEKLDPLKYLPK